MINLIYKIYKLIKNYKMAQEGLFETYFNADDKELKSLNKITFKRGMQLKLKAAANCAEDRINAAETNLNKERASLKGYNITYVLDALDILVAEKARLEAVKNEYSLMFGEELV